MSHCNLAESALPMGLVCKLKLKMYSQYLKIEVFITKSRFLANWKDLATLGWNCKKALEKASVPL